MAKKSTQIIEWIYQNALQGKRKQFLCNMNMCGMVTKIQMIIQ